MLHDDPRASRDGRLCEQVPTRAQFCLGACCHTSPPMMYHMRATSPCSNSEICPRSPVHHRFVSGGGVVVFDGTVYFDHLLIRNKITARPRPWLIAHVARRPPATGTMAMVLLDGSKMFKKDGARTTHAMGSTHGCSKWGKHHVSVEWSMSVRSGTHKTLLRSVSTRSQLTSDCAKSLW